MEEHTTTYELSLPKILKLNLVKPVDLTAAKSILWKVLKIDRPNFLKKLHGRKRIGLHVD